MTTITALSKRQFASYIVKTMGRSRVTHLQVERSLEDRLAAIRDLCERFDEARDVVYEDALPHGYNPASYGLWLVVYRNILPSATYLALQAMTIRQLCEVVHTLLTESGDLASAYPSFLMERYS